MYKFRSRDTPAYAERFQVAGGAHIPQALVSSQLIIHLHRPLLEQRPHFLQRKGSIKEHGDYGADLILGKGPVTTVVQANRWSGKVRVSAIQEITAAQGYGAGSAMVVTNSFFAKEAIELARTNNVVLWNRNKIKDEVLAEQAQRATARNQSSAKRVTVKSVGKPVVHSPAPSNVGQRANKRAAYER
ncbi:MAG: restriction endonuclease [Firmicutes bacterium]|nr:restriction endonuclease [Candidatus Fermentithermobacillaceae bacterium]